MLLQPTPPSIEVTPLTTATDLSALAKHMRANPDMYVGLPNITLRGDIQRLRANNNVVYLPDTSNRAAGETIVAKIGSHLLISQNGFRTITENAAIMRGDLTGVDPKLFTPVIATLN